MKLKKELTDINNLLQQIEKTEQTLLIKKNKNLTRHLRRLINLKRKLVIKEFTTPCDTQSHEKV